MKKKIIVDCDVGVDDALALILAFHSPELEVMAITGVNGNVPLEKVMKNIKKVLSLLRPPHRPIVAQGADRPLKGDLVHAQSVHGEDGLGRVKIQLRPWKKQWHTFPQPAEELIIKMARQYPKEISLIAVGPLTNLALAWEKDSEGMRKLKEVVIMGGAVRTRGNITPYAEFNFFVDPLAAKTVLDSGLPITLVPLDVTHQVPLTLEAMEEKVKPIHHPISQFVIKATGYDFIAQQFQGGAKVFYLHDPLAVGAVIDPNLVRTERLYLSVETEAGEQYGQIGEVSGGKGLRRSKI